MEADCWCSSEIALEIKYPYCEGTNRRVSLVQIVVARLPTSKFSNITVAMFYLIQADKLVRESTKHPL